MRGTRRLPINKLQSQPQLCRAALRKVSFEEIAEALNKRNSRISRHTVYRALCSRAHATSSFAIRLLTSLPPPSARPPVFFAGMIDVTSSGSQPTRPAINCYRAAMSPDRSTSEKWNSFRRGSTVFFSNQPDFSRDTVGYVSCVREMDERRRLAGRVEYS